MSFSSLRNKPPPPPPSDMSSSEGEISHHDSIDEIDLATLQPSSCKLQPIRNNLRRQRDIVVTTDSRKRKGHGSRVSKRKRKPSSKVLDTLKQVKDLAANLTELESKHDRPMSFAEKIDHLMQLTSLPNGECNDLNPHALAASVNPNILSHRDAMKADDSHLFTSAMEEEITRMIENNIFEEVDRNAVPLTHNVLRAVWSHRRKTTPAGVVYRHRSRLCVDGSQQKEGIDFHETYSPVVSWTTVRILLILAVLLNLKTRQVDYVQAFPQASLPEGEQVFMQIPDGYKASQGGKRVLKLKKNLYGLRQASYNWSNLLRSGLEKLGFKQSANEPCLFLKDDIICCVYVDDTLFFAKTDEIIDEHIKQLQAINFELTDEGDVENFLGVKIDKLDNGHFKMSQPALTDTIISTLGLDTSSKQHKTPAVSPPIHADPTGDARKEKWNYRSVIGMLIYLSRNTRPDIEYAVHQCARFQLNPTTIHENAVKRIGRYLLGTKDKGIIFKPDLSSKSELNCYVDADFAGNYTKDTGQDPNNVRSRTGCVIKFAGCPILWFSRLQTEISLSTTEAEYIALSTACRELLPMRSLFIELGKYLQCRDITPDVKCTLFEDNVGAETLAKAPKMSPRTKHIATKYHHFRYAVKRGFLKITRVDTSDQLADILTKAVPLPVLEHLRPGIMGWLSMFRIVNQPTEKHVEFRTACFMALID